MRPAHGEDARETSQVAHKVVVEHERDSLALDALVLSEADLCRTAQLLQRRVRVGALLAARLLDDKAREERFVEEGRDRVRPADAELLLADENALIGADVAVGDQARLEVHVFVGELAAVVVWVVVVVVGSRFGRCVVRLHLSLSLRCVEKCCVVGWWRRWGNLLLLTELFVDRREYERL